MKTARRSPPTPQRAGKPQNNLTRTKTSRELRDSVTLAVQDYLKKLDGETGTDFYQQMMAVIEPPMLEEIMRYTHHNQTRAAQMLGLSRGTLRKKLRQYGLLDRRNGR